MNKLVYESDRYQNARRAEESREARRGAVAILHERGYTQKEIAEALEVSQPTIARDLAYLENAPEEEAIILLKKAQEVIDATDTTLLRAMYNERDAILKEFGRIKVDMNKRRV